MAFTFKDFLFGQLPLYFKENDTYKDIYNAGLLERYLRIFGLEVDEEVYPLIRNYLNQVDPLVCEAKFLSTIAFTLGSPPDFTGVEEDYRKLLSYVLNIYRIKGTKKSYDLLFALFGLTVDVEEYFIDDVLYDDGHIYDVNDLYDTFCLPCSEYSLLFGSKLDDCIPPSFDTGISLDTLGKIVDIIEFIQPINATLRVLARNYKICESVTPDTQEDIAICIYNPDIYDNTITYENSVEYDNDYDFVCIFIPTSDERQFDESFDLSFN